MDYSKLQSRVDAGLVRKQDHPRYPISIYNYSQRVQYEKLWDEVTTQARGLVMHGERIIARPFGKFFNDTEYPADAIPWHLRHEVTEKLDGSLLIAFNFNGKWLTATRGSFVSEQAIHGADLLNRLSVTLDPAITHLWELIYPENRIVVNYGSRRECVLLAMIETETGIELSLDDAPRGVPVVRRLASNVNTRELRTIIRDDEEGYVVRFANGFRVKVKGERYIELHRVVTGVSSRSIWECLSQGKELESILEIAPDECAEWIRMERDRFLEQMQSLKADVSVAHAEVFAMPDRKSQALHLMANHRDIAPAVFAALDDKSVETVLWKKLYPEFRRPSIADRIEA